MELSIYLAQLLGVYFIFAGILVILRQKALIPVVTEYGNNRPLLLALSFIELAAGLALIIGHQYYTFDWKGLITFAGWWMVVEAVLYLTLSDARVRKMIKFFNNSTWYTLGGALSIIMGIYLANAGFGLGFF